MSGKVSYAARRLLWVPLVGTDLTIASGIGCLDIVKEPPDEHPKVTKSDGLALKFAIDRGNQDTVRSLLENEVDEVIKPDSSNFVLPEWSDVERYEQLESLI